MNYRPVAILVALASAILAPLVAQASPALPGDFVGLEVADDAESQGCPPSLAVCVLRLENNGTASLGDDRVDAERAIASIVLRARPGSLPLVGPALAPLLPYEDIATDPKRWSFYVPIIATIGSVDEHLVDPLAIDSVARLEVTEERMNWSVAGGPEDGLYYGGGFYINRTHVSPVPPGATLGGDGTDGILRSIEHKPCPAREGRKLDRACDLADATLASFFAATPALAAGATVPRADVEPNAPAPSHIASAPSPTRSASFAVAQAPHALAIGPGREPEGPLPLPRNPAFNPQVQQQASTAVPAALATVHAAEPQSGGPTPALVVAAATATALAALAGLPLWRLYKRVQDRDLARQETRAALLAYVREHPGARLQETADAVSVNRNAIMYHARRLARANALVVRADTGITRFFLPGVEPSSGSARTPLDHPVAREIVLALGREESLARRVLRDRVPAPPRTVDWHLARLQREGIVAAREGVGGAAFSLARATREATIDRVLSD